MKWITTPTAKLSPIALKLQSAAIKFHSTSMAGTDSILPWKSNCTQKADTVHYSSKEN